MSRSYELALVIDPRESDDAVKAEVDKYKKILTDGGGRIDHEDHWGKRKLAYPIHKLNEGKYVFLYVSADGALPWPTVERLLGQNEKVLRHLVVRTDEDLKRAARKGKVQPEQPFRASSDTGGHGGREGRDRDGRDRDGRDRDGRDRDRDRGDRDGRDRDRGDRDGGGRDRDGGHYGGGYNR